MAENELAASIDKLTNQNRKNFEERKKSIEANKNQLEETKIAIEAAGGVAEDNKKFNKLSSQIQKDELQLRYDQADSPSAKREIREEQRALALKQGNLLAKISQGITGILSNITEMGKKALKGGLSFLKKTLFAAAILAVLAFINSPMWDELVELAADGAVFLSKKVKPALKKFKEIFDGIADFFGVTNTELALYALGGMFAFKLISKVLRIGKSLLAVGKFITSGLITPLVNVVKNAPKVIWDAIKNVGTVFTNVRKFLMANMITPMTNAVKNAATNIWDKIKTLPATLVKMRMFMVTNILNPMKIALKNAYMKGWNIIKTLPSTLRLMRIFMMTNILNPLTASSTATGAKKWAFMSKITNAIKALRVFFLASFLPMIAGFMTPFMPIILIGAGIALVLYALYEAFQDFKDTLDRTGSIGEAIKVAIGKFVGVLLGAIPALFLKLVAFVADLFGFKEFAKKIGDIDPIQWIADTVTGLIDNVVDFFKLLFDFDFGAWAKSLLPNWAKRWLGFSDEPEPVTPEQKKMQREAEIKELAKRSARLKATRGVGKEGKRLQAEALAEAKELDEKIKKLKESGEADVQKAIEKGYQGDIAQVEDLSEAEKKAFKAQQTEKTKKQKDYEGVVKDVVKKTAQQAAEGSTITNLAAGFGPTSFVATPESPVVVEKQQKTSTMQEQAAARAARMGISSPYTNVTAFNPTNISADKTTNHYSFDNKRFHPDSVPTMLTNAL